MNGLALLLAASALGVDYGWRPHEEGGLEYIIQIEPEVFASLQKGGGDILSEIHPEARDVRLFRIRVGRGPLPRKGGEELLAADDGPLPPAPPGDTTTDTESTPDTKSSPTSRSGSPPLNHLAQGSGYGSPFGGYSRTGGNSISESSGAAATYGVTGGSTPATSSTTTPAYSGGSRSGYSEYNGRTTSSGTSTAASPATTTGANGDGWSSGGVRTASNQQPVSNSSATTTNATSRSAAASTPPTPASTSGTTADNQGAAGRSGSAVATQPTYESSSATQSQPGYGTSAAASSQPAYGSTNSAQAQPAYGATTGGQTQPTYGSTTGGYSSTTQAQAGGADSNAAPTNSSNVNNEYPGRYGPLTPVSSNNYDTRPAPPPSGYEGQNGAATNNGNVATAPSNAGWSNPPQDNRSPPPAYVQNNGYNGGNTTQPAANPGYSNPPPGAYNTATPPLLAPPAQAPTNYGYASVGVPGYPYAPPAGAGYGYGQAPGYYGIPGLTPPVLTASNTTDSSSRSRSRDEDDDTERERRSYSPPPVPAAPTPVAQGTILGTEPWLAFTVTILLLFISIGGNIYLLWISQDFYWRYKELANDLRTFNSATS